MSPHFSMMDGAAALTRLNNPGSKASCQRFFFPSCKGTLKGCWFSGSPSWLTLSIMATLWKQRQRKGQGHFQNEIMKPVVGWERGFGVGVGKFLVILNVCLWLLEKWYWIWWNHRAVRNCTDNLVQLLEFIGEEINRGGYLGGLVCSRIILRPSWTDTKTFSFEPLSLYETTLFSSDGYFFNRTPFIFS